MKILTKICISTSLAASLLAGVASAAAYNLDTANSSVKFSVSHMKLTKVDGEFKDFSGKIDYDGGKLNVLEGSVAIQSIDTANEKRNAHLNAPDMFDSAKHPHITFKMTDFSGGKIHGDLTIKDTTKHVAFDAKVAENGNKITIDATGAINRSEFGIAWPSVFKDNAVGEEVSIILHLVASK